MVKGSRKTTAGQQGVTKNICELAYRRKQLPDAQGYKARQGLPEGKRTVQGHEQRNRRGGGGGGGVGVGRCRCKSWD